MIDLVLHQLEAVALPARHSLKTSNVFASKTHEKLVGGEICFCTNTCIKDTLYYLHMFVQCHGNLA